MSPTRHATIMLVVVTGFWSLSFPLVTKWQRAAFQSLNDPLLSALTLIALRMLPALLILLLLQPRLARGLTRPELLGGAWLGAVFFLGFALQTWGMATVSPALSAFLTSLCSAWAPLLGWLLLGMRVAPVTLAGLALGVVGTAVLVLKPGQELSAGIGDVLTAIASLLFGLQMLLLDRLGRKARPGSLTVGFFATAGLLALLTGTIRASSGVGVAEWASWIVEQHRAPEMRSAVVLLVLLPTVLGFHWMNVYQPRVSTSRASLIYLLEPILAAAISIPLGYDVVSVPLVVGGALILSGNALVELLGRRGIREAA
jgi:drug/metabolite transporter (DMT)-like permease